MTTTGMERNELSEEDEAIYEAPEPDEGKWGALRMIGLLALLAAFAGFVYLAYMQGVRNGSAGAPPVITADNTPYKSLPPNPGGKVFENQDKIIFDQVAPEAATASREAPAPRVSKPQAPEKASGDDLVTHESPPLVVAESRAPPTTIETKAPQTVPLSIPTVPRAQSEAQADRIADAIAQADKRGQGGPISAADELSPRPSETANAAPQPSTGVTGATESPTSSVPTSQATTVSGAYMVQIASYRDMPSAQDAWTKFSAKFSDLSGALNPDYQTADVPGKGTYFRLRVGPFQSKEEANTLCSTLKSRSQGCLVVKSRDHS